MVYTKDLGHAQRELWELVILLGVCLEYSICSLLQFLFLFFLYLQKKLIQQGIKIKRTTQCLLSKIACHHCQSICSYLHFHYCNHIHNFLLQCLDTSQRLVQHSFTCAALIFSCVMSCRKNALIKASWRTVRCREIPLTTKGYSTVSWLLLK